MNPSQVIQKKRDGQELSQTEIHEFIHGLSTGSVADYQASAFLMAIYFQGMTDIETVHLTSALLKSGIRYQFPHLKGPKIDKHSTGGVGDKVSLILAPLAAACGLYVPMMSGRGLGFSGGTLDKLESIPGFKVNLSEKEFENILKTVGCAMTGQTDQIAPADKKLYALRDVTGTVECIPLIVASILSKKLAEGTEGLILDVKFGSGAFMKTQSRAQQLAKALLKTAHQLDLPCHALLSNMDQPLGYAVGNALEVQECIEVLKSETHNDLSNDLKELTLQLCAQMLLIAKKVRTATEGKKLALSKIQDGKAWSYFQKLVQLQNGNLTLFEKNLSRPTQTVQWLAQKSGYLSKINTETIGNILIELGGGRKKMTDRIDPNVGLIFHKKLGHLVKKGECIVTVHSPQATDLSELEIQFHRAIQISKTKQVVPKLISKILVQ